MRSPGDATPAFVFAPELAGPGQRLELTGDDAHYVTRVCRARPGDTVRASNGRGLVARLRLTSQSPLIADVVELEPHDPSGGGWVLTGAPEGQRADWMVEKLAELGVTRWQPLSCARSPWASAPARLDRWERLATAALRQSRAAWRMEVASPIEVAAAFDGLPAGGDAGSPIRMARRFRRRARVGRPQRSRRHRVAMPVGTRMTPRARLASATSALPTSSPSARPRASTTASASACSPRGFVRPVSRRAVCAPRPRRWRGRRGTLSKWCTGTRPAAG